MLIVENEMYRANDLFPTNVSQLDGPFEERLEDDIHHDEKSICSYAPFAQINLKMKLVLIFNMGLHVPHTTFRKPPTIETIFFWTKE